MNAENKLPPTSPDETAEAAASANVSRSEEAGSGDRTSERTLNAESGESAGGDAIRQLVLDTVVPTSRRLRTVRRLAEGGMGRIDLVIDEALQRRVAKKVLRPALRNRPSLVRSFLREAQITGQLDHPSIVPIHELGVDPEGRLYFTMKLIEGETLKEVIKRLPEPPLPRQQLFEILEIMLKVCDALAFAHSRGVIHCDVKPANVMVGAFGQVYLMDWGLARVQTKDEETSVKPSVPEGESGGVAGTAGYMAPEQALAEELDERTDVFGVGCLLCYVFIKRAPFKADSIMASLALAREAEVLAGLDDLPPGTLAPALAEIIGHATAKDPEDRYQSVAELRRDLARFMTGGEDFPERHVRAGDYIMREGDPGDAAYILVRGRARVFKMVAGRTIELGQVNEGEVVGELAILEDTPRTASVVAVDDCTLLEVSVDTFEREVDQLKPWMGAFTRTLAKRFREREESRLAGSKAKEPLATDEEADSS